MFDIPQNINTFKQMEKALRIGEKRFNLAMQDSNDELWDWNLETNNLYLSPRWKQMLGYAENEIAYHFTEFVNRIHPKDVEITMETILNYLQKKIPHYEIAIRMRHKEGYYIWILARGIAVWNEQEIPYRIGVLRWT